MDGSHPTFNNHIGYGRMRKGIGFEIKSQDGWKLINLMGAYNPKDGEVIVQDYDTLTGDAVMNFLAGLRRRNGEKKLHIICDNARYQHAKEVKEFAKTHTIHLVYLPGYSPNLNLIKRYWGFLMKRVLVNHYYETYERFKEAILTFSRSKSKRLKNYYKDIYRENFISSNRYLPDNTFKYISVELVYAYSVGKQRFYAQAGVGLLWILIVGGDYDCSEK
jgi:transposase